MKNTEEIYQALAGEFQTRTGLSAGGNGDLAVRFYAVAAQLSGLYAQADWVKRQCFPQTATGESLDLHAQERGLERRPALKATGVVRFFAGEERTETTRIPLGTICMTAGGQRYLTTRAGNVSVAERSVDLPVAASEAGAAWNAGEGEIIYMVLPPSGITACTNPAALTNGEDREEDEALRQRVLATYRRLANGANAVFYEQEALSINGVAAVKVIPRSRGVGTVDVIAAAWDGMPGESLLQQLQSHFDRVREIAVDVSVLSPARREVDISVSLVPADGYTFDQISETVQQELERWFDGKLLGKPVLQAKLTAMVFGVEGVANCSVAIDGGDVSVDAMTLPCLGKLTIAEG